MKNQAELTAELTIKKFTGSPAHRDVSAFDALQFAKAGACEITFVEPEDDDQKILSVQDVQEYYERLREMRAESEAMDRELIDRIERVLEANDGRI